MGEAPEPPRERPAQLDPAEVNHGAPLADRRQVSGVLVAEGRRRGRGAKPGADHVGDVDALLLGGWRDAGNRLSIRAKDDRRVADRENLTLPRDREIGFNLETAYPVGRGVEPEGSGRGLNTGSPDDRDRKSVV